MDEKFSYIVRMHRFVFCLAKNYFLTTEGGGYMGVYDGIWWYMRIYANGSIWKYIVSCEHNQEGTHM